MIKKKKQTNAVKKKQTVIKLNKAELDLLKSVGMAKKEFDHMHRMGMTKKEILIWAGTTSTMLSKKKGRGVKKTKTSVRVWPWLIVGE